MQLDGRGLGMAVGNGGWGWQLPGMGVVGNGSCRCADGSRKLHPGLPERLLCRWYFVPLDLARLIPTC